MLVNKKVSNTWKILKEHGDVAEIAKLSEELSENKDSNIKKVSRITISAALRTNRMNENTFEVIRKFYEEKKKRQDLAQKKTLEVIEDGN